MEKPAYPLKFEPLYRHHPWGGTLMAETLDRRLSTNEPLGESLEIVDDGDIQSIVANGPLAGTSLRELVENHATTLVSNRHRPADRFPLLVKYLDTGRRLPVLVHPDELASDALRARPNSKMWFIAAARPNSSLYVGIKPKTTQQQVLNHLNSPDLQDVLQSFPSEPGDAYYISSGRVHSLNLGNLVLSIEQGHIDALIVSNFGGNDGGAAPTAEALEESLAAIHFQDRSIARIRCESNTVQRNRKLPLVNLCPHFTVDELRLIQPMHERTDGSSFHILTAMDGAAEVTLGKHAILLDKGQSCLIPAELGYYAVAPARDQLTKVLKSSLRT